MNEQQIDNLLEDMKSSNMIQNLHGKTNDEFCQDFHNRLAQNRRRRLLAAVSVITVIFVLSVFLRMGNRPARQNDLQPLEMAEAIFPETGVALINGEVVTCDRQVENSADYCLKMRLSNHDGTAPMTIDVIVSDNDYVTIGNGPVTGDLLISRWSDSEAVVEFSLTVGQQHVLKDIVAVQKSGGHFAANASSKDYNLELQILPIREAI
ncbi:MAG: hypothetical protein IJU61_03455 [Victivallales bacterium]|nr:hypothetical protein [Victivallales bacterium]